MTISNIICKIKACHQHLGYLSAEYKKNIFHRLSMFSSFLTLLALIMSWASGSQSFLKGCRNIVYLIPTRFTISNTVARITTATNPNRQKIMKMLT